MNKKKIVLKIDVDTYRGTKIGVPALAALLKKYHANATFLFSLGPDHTGRALRRIFRPGFFKKVKRTSVLSHYGIKTLLYGVLLPGPDIAKKCKKELLAVKEAGFEVGVHTYDHVAWQDFVTTAPRAWTHGQLTKAFKAFESIFGVPSATFGAAGWQMNDFAFEWLSSKVSYGSSTRGDCPFYPLYKVEHSVHKGALELPTNIPTMDELLGLDGINESNIGHHLVSLTEKLMTEEFLAQGLASVFTLHAELEGMKLLNAFEEYLKELTKLGYEFISMGEYGEALEKNKNFSINEKEIILKEIPGRSGVLCT